MNANLLIRLVTQAAKNSTNSKNFEELSQHTQVSATTLARWASGTHTEGIENFLELLQLMPKQETREIFNKALYFPPIQVFKDPSITPADAYVFCNIIKEIGDISLEEALNFCIQHHPIKNISENILKDLATGKQNHSLICKKNFVEPYSSQVHMGFLLSNLLNSFAQIVDDIEDLTIQNQAPEFTLQDNNDLVALNFWITAINADIPTSKLLDLIVKTQTHKFQKNKWVEAKTMYLEGSPDWIEATPLSPVAKLWIRVNNRTYRRTMRFFKSYKTYLILKCQNNF